MVELNVDINEECYEAAKKVSKAYYRAFNENMSPEVVINSCLKIHLITLVKVKDHGDLVHI